MLLVQNCLVCKGTVFYPYLTCKDNTVSGEEFTIVSCQGCHFKFTNPRPKTIDLSKYYKSEAYISHSNTKKGLISQLYHLVRKYTLKQKLKIVKPYLSGESILDYGCGTGMFLKTCSEAKINAYGIEPDDDAKKIALSMGLSVFSNKQTLLSTMPNVKFGAISLWHVLEHVTDLDDTINFFNSKLNPSGVLIIALPNYKSFDAEYYKQFWAAYDLPRHLYHFDKKTIKQLFTNHGFELINTLPMKFDSYYVSMLSNRYKGLNNHFKALLTAFLSNAKAKKTGNYSSLIYIFRKGE